ncbi:YHS domain-containing (seleno)protein [Methylopila musalis]|uniref:YHS domain-containing (Seleno)protein n=1 Tax=Methylopila musalis TaxID=1134781 RepID=A0ABW3ZAX3_9HYPH
MASRTLTAVALLASLMAASGTSVRALPGLDERTVTDPATGVALYGYDPVAYFVEKRAVRGLRDCEAEWNGVAWRFASEANRAAFLSAPEVYAPRFGGYAPAAVANGAAAPGHPLIFAVREERLYLFRSPAERDAFADPRAAEQAWPKLEAELPRG